METLVIAALLCTGWRVLKWVGRAVREVCGILGWVLESVASGLVRPSQAERDRQAVERLLREVACQTPE